MLVLSRKPKEGLKIGDDVMITVLSIEGDRVRLGIDAPAAVRILRAETIEKAAQENKLAASASLNLAQMFLKMDQNT